VITFKWDIETGRRVAFFLMPATFTQCNYDSTLETAIYIFTKGIAWQSTFLKSHDNLILILLQKRDDRIETASIGGLAFGIILMYNN